MQTGVTEKALAKARTLPSPICIPRGCISDRNITAPPPPTFDPHAGPLGGNDNVISMYPAATSSRTS
jgi:hypothetical protein